LIFHVQLSDLKDVLPALTNQTTNERAKRGDLAKKLEKLMKQRKLDEAAAAAESAAESAAAGAASAAGAAAAEDESKAPGKKGSRKQAGGASKAQPKKPAAASEPREEDDASGGKDKQVDIQTLVESKIWDNIYDRGIIKNIAEVIWPLHLYGKKKQR
jgi:hypothetical protein